MSQQSSVPTNWSLPFVERGDVVRLKDPYQPDWEMAHEPVKQQLRRALFEDSDVDTSFEDEPADVRLSIYRDSEAAAEYLELTHGTVAQIVSRYSAGTYDLSEAAPYLQDGSVGHTRRPVRNVDLHLYNPSVGIAYFDSGTGLNGIPAYVQEHTANHILVQKHDDSYGPEEVDIAAAHRQLDIAEAEGFDSEWADE